MLRYRAIEKPSSALRDRRDDDESDDDDGEQGVGMVNVNKTGLRNGGGVGTGGRAGDSDDSDFDL